MGLFDGLKKKIKSRKEGPEITGPAYEFCPRCEANLTLQKGYSNELPYWICKGCGEMLINPSVPGDTAWICDQCEAMLNLQNGFREECGAWTCTECGFINKIDQSEIYLSDDEYKADINSPYKGLSDAAVLELSLYSEEGAIQNRDDILLVRNVVDHKLYLKKILSTYDISVYEYLMEHPISHMPKIVGVYESDNNLLVLEEYIEGKTLSELLTEGPIDLTKAITIARSICTIAKELHCQDKPIIHRDIKPSNIMLDDHDVVFLLDINVAKWFNEEEIEDTRLLGTQYYAAPEQLGYGFSASSDKSDIYAIGILLNVMVTGKMPKEKKAPQPIWDIVENCIKLEPENRYTDRELLDALDAIVE